MTNCLCRGWGEHMIFRNRPPRPLLFPAPALRGAVPRDPPAGEGARRAPHIVSAAQHCGGEAAEVALIPLSPASSADKVTSPSGARTRPLLQEEIVIGGPWQGRTGRQLEAGPPRESLTLWEGLVSPCTMAAQILPNNAAARQGAAPEHTKGFSSAVAQGTQRLSWDALPSPRECPGPKAPTGPRWVLVLAPGSPRAACGPITAHPCREQGLLLVPLHCQHCCCEE